MSVCVPAVKVVYNALLPAEKNFSLPAVLAVGAVLSSPMTMPAVEVVAMVRSSRILASVSMDVPTSVSPSNIFSSVAVKVEATATPPISHAPSIERVEPASMFKVELLSTLSLVSLLRNERESMLSNVTASPTEALMIMFAPELSMVTLVPPSRTTLSLLSLSVTTLLAPDEALVALKDHLSPI